MKSGVQNFELNELFFFFPILVTNFVNFVFDALGEEFEKEPMAKGQVGVLLILKKFGPMPISRIGDRLLIAKANMTSLIDLLVQKGFVERCASQSDRRIINIAMTEAGIGYLKEMAARLDEILVGKLSVLSPEESVELRRSLNSLSELGTKVLEG